MKTIFSDKDICNSTYFPSDKYCLIFIVVGGHSLGQANPANSGFHSPWDKTPISLDNGYYRAMSQSHKWVAELVDNSVTRYEGPDYLFGIWWGVRKT